MEYVYAAMLIHKAGKTVDEATVTGVLKAAGVEPDATRVKALVAALDGVDIEKAIETAAVPVAAAAAPAAGGAPAGGDAGDKKEDAAKKEKEEKKSEEAAAAGLGALFG